MWGSGADGHNRDWVTHWYIQAYKKAPEVSRRHNSPIFLNVSLEAARWVWFTDPIKAIEMLNWALATNWAKDHESHRKYKKKHKEMKEERDYFLNPITPKLHYPQIRPPTRIYNSNHV